MKTNPINWTEFNGEKFQAFCNDLLSFEFGKNYIPFTAPGGDQSIDGLFDGEYNSKTGKWRFQAKFHHPDTGRVSGFNQLKAQIKKDITENIQDETTVIFITNVELNPNQRKEIKTTTGKTLQENGKVVDFDIWDGAKIYTLLAHHPIVKLWYTDQTKYLILEYSEYFREELNAAQNTSYALSNITERTSSKSSISLFGMTQKRWLSLVVKQASGRQDFVLSSSGNISIRRVIGKHWLL